ncbi:MAG: M42 family metallopeptidase [Candidatus Korobacteraceae bacterium]
MQLLERLTQTPGVPGREHRIRAVIEAYLKEQKIFDELRTDVMGSLIGVRRPRPAVGAPKGDPTRVLVAAHMDQIGFLVSHISEDGFLRAHPVGSFDTRNLFARRVTVCAGSGDDLPGVMNPAGRPIHTASGEELKKIPELGDFFIDLSLPGDAVKQRVELGDMIVLDGPFGEVGESIVSQALDNRVGCWALIRAMECLSSHNCEIYAVWTAQEELGSRGAEPVSFGIEADIGISCDTTVCCKIPGVLSEHHITLPGKGVSIQIADSSTIADASLVKDLENIARENGINCQRSLMLGGGQDGAKIQRSRRGVRTVVLSCPVKYLHTVTEMVHRDDLASYRDLLARYLSTL